jgi:hypothetical protein
MKAIYSSKVYTLLDDRENPMGALTYLSRFSQKSAIRSRASASAIDLNPKRFSSSIKLVRENQEIGVAKVKGSGIELRLTLKDKSRSLTINRKGFWKSVFILLNEEKEQLAVLTPSFNWRSWHYNYTIERTRGERYEIDPDTILLAVYFANYITAVTE